MSYWLEIQNNTGYQAAPPEIVTIDWPITQSNDCTIPINKWNCSYSGTSGKCEKGQSYIVAPSCTNNKGVAVGWGIYDPAAGGSILTIAIRDSGYNLLGTFKVNPTNPEKIADATYTMPNGTVVTYGCGVTNNASNPYGNIGYLISVYVLSVVVPPQYIYFVNNTSTPISINYPASGLSNWTGSMAGSNYQVDSRQTALGLNNGFISLANSSGGAQLAPYGTSELYSHLVTFPSNSSPILIPGKNPSATQNSYMISSSYSTGTGSDTYTITIAPVAPIPNITWDATTPVLKQNGVPTVVHGLSLTTMESLVGGLGMLSFCNYSYPSSGVIDFTQPNLTELNAILAVLPKPTAGITPAVRISLNAAYYLGVMTKPMQAKWNTFPNSAPFNTQYQTLLNNIINFFYGNGVVTILDLHWNDDVTQQQPMALVGSNSTGDSIQFFQSLASKYGNNPLVWYELYNEPYMDSNSNSSNWTSIWLNGGTVSNNSYYGMMQLYNAIGNVKGLVVIAGAFDYAYDDTSLIQFQNITKSTNVIYNFHPYQGDAQGPEKIPTAFESMISNLSDKISRPIIITETGQVCCISNGLCKNYNGTYNSSSMGYLEAILNVAQVHNISWTLWGWRPNAYGLCAQPDANNADSLMSSLPGAPGADYATLIPKYGNIGPTSVTEK